MSPTCLGTPKISMKVIKRAPCVWLCLLIIDVYDIPILPRLPYLRLHVVPLGMVEVLVVDVAYGFPYVILLATLIVPFSDQR